MSSPDPALFDLLTGAPAPFTGFGQILKPSVVVPRFREAVRQAHERLQEVFHLEPGANSQVAQQIENVVASMWAEGWDPNKADFDLFARDFGTVIADAILVGLGGEIVFRSETDLSHVSIWWESLRTETFPYHKVAKRLLRREGEDLCYYWESLVRIVLWSPGASPRLSP